MKLFINGRRWFPFDCGLCSCCSLTDDDGSLLTAVCVVVVHLTDDDGSLLTAVCVVVVPGAHEMVSTLLESEQSSLIRRRSIVQFCIQRQGIFSTFRAVGFLEASTIKQTLYNNV